MVGMVKRVSQTWTYNHKLLIVCMSLVVVIGWQEYGGEVIDLIPTAQAVYYESQECDLGCKIEEGARKLYLERESIDMERYRLEVINTYNRELLELTYDSPFVDYELIKEIIK